VAMFGWNMVANSGRHGLGDHKFVYITAESFQLRRLRFINPKVNSSVKLSTGSKEG
jgi:hypothetical protein